MTRVARASMLLAFLALGCADTEGEGAVPKREFQTFQREVYPVLLRDCGFPACHGSPKRFFKVFGPGRTRLPNAMGELPAPFDLPSGDELSTSYSLAQSMIDAADPKASLLLRKPLAVAAGGAGHLATDDYDRDVYRTAQDSGYVSIARWVYSEPMPPMTP